MSTENTQLAEHYLQKDPAALDREERTVLTALGTRRAISRDAADLDE